MIEAYLRELDSCLRGHWPSRKRILEEARTHLEDSAAEARARRGLDQASAEGEAVARYGAARTVAIAWAEARLSAQVAWALTWSPLIVAVLFAANFVEPLFQAHAHFHGGDPLPESLVMISVGEVMQLMMVAVLLVAWPLTKRVSAKAGSNLLVAALVFAVFGLVLTTVGRSLCSLSVEGDPLSGATMLRFALAFAVFGAWSPVGRADESLRQTARS